MVAEENSNGLWHLIQCLLYPQEQEVFRETNSMLS